MSEQDENQNFAAKFREAQKEIDRLARERDEARAACAVMRPIVIEYAELHHRHMYGGRLQDPMGVHALLIRSSPGQPLLDELDRLRRLEAGVGNDELRTNVALTAALKGMEPLDVADLYRAVLLAAMKGETK